MVKKKILIVGGGTAGLVIANNLQDHYEVTVIDKCQFKRYPLIYKIPLMIGVLFRSKINKYIIKKEFIINDGRVIPFFESNVLGGASVINGCVHTLGSRIAWEKILKKYSLSYEDIIKSYKILYSSSGKKNKISVMPAPTNVVDIAFADAVRCNGIPAGDMNFGDKECYGPVYNTRLKFFRTSVLSLIKKHRFKVRLDEKVKSVEFDSNRRVVGVTTNKGRVNSDYVILAAGVCGTCNLLLDKSFQQAAGDLFESLLIGGEIQDHTNLRVNVVSRIPIGSLNEIHQSLYKKILIFLKHCIGLPTLMVGTGATSGVHLDLDHDGIVDTRIHIVQFTETGRHGSSGDYFSPEAGFSLSITPIAPKSRGVITVEEGKTTVNPRYLESEVDVEMLRRALDFCLKLLRSDAFSDIVKEIVNERVIADNPDKYIRDNIFSGHHLIGGCHNAIDNQFKISPVEGLYACDASILECYPASNIHSSVVLMADLFSKSFLFNNAARDMESNQNSVFGDGDLLEKRDI